MEGAAEIVAWARCGPDAEAVGSSGGAGSRREASRRAPARRSERTCIRRRGEVPSLQAARRPGGRPPRRARRSGSCKRRRAASAASQGAVRNSHARIVRPPAPAAATGSAGTMRVDAFRIGLDFEPILGHRVIRRSLRLLAAGLLVCGLAVAPAASRSDDAGQGAFRLRVMTLNIFYGATSSICARATGAHGAAAARRRSPRWWRRSGRPEPTSSASKKGRTRPAASPARSAGSRASGRGSFPVTD